MLDSFSGFEREVFLLYLDAIADPVSNAPLLYAYVDYNPTFHAA